MSRARARRVAWRWRNYQNRCDKVAGTATGADYFFGPDDRRPPRVTGGYLRRVMGHRPGPRDHDRHGWTV